MKNCVYRSNLSCICETEPGVIVKFAPCETIIRDFAMATRVRGPYIVEYQAVNVYTQPQFRWTSNYIETWDDQHSMGITMRKYSSNLAVATANLTDTQLMRIIIFALMAMHRIAEADVVHCDMKAENFLVDVNATGDITNVACADFGLAQDVNSLKSTFVQTYDHHAPELRYEPPNFSRYGSEVDSWSMGVMLYGLATGRRLWPTASRSLGCTRIGLAKRLGRALEGVDEDAIRDYPGFAAEYRATFAELIAHDIRTARPFVPGLAELVSGLLDLDPAQRMRPHEALCHVTKCNYSTPTVKHVAEFSAGLVREMHGRVEFEASRLVSDTFAASVAPGAAKLLARWFSRDGRKEVTEAFVFAAILMTASTSAIAQITYYGMHEVCGVACGRERAHKMVKFFQSRDSFAVKDAVARLLCLSE